MHGVNLSIVFESEVVAASALNAAEGFTRWVRSSLVALGYASAFYFLSLTLHIFPLGVTFAIWSGVGIALVSEVGWAIYHQSLDVAGLVGISLFVEGVVVMNLFSKAVSDSALIQWTAPAFQFERYALFPRLIFGGIAHIHINI